MPHIQVTGELSVDANTLWRRVGSFQQVDWHPMLANIEGEGEEPGAVRKPTTRDGQEQTEKLLEMNPSEHFYRYAIVSTPIPAKDWIAEFRVTGHHDGTSTLTWTGDFAVDPKEEQKTVGIVRGFLEAGVEALKQQYSFALPR